jgi:hypothetical protein
MIKVRIWTEYACCGKGCGNCEKLWNLGLSARVVKTTSPKNFVYSTEKGKIILATGVLR